MDTSMNTLKRWGSLQIHANIGFPVPYQAIENGLFMSSIEWKHGSTLSNWIEMLAHLEYSNGKLAQFWVIKLLTLAPLEYCKWKLGSILSN